MTVLSFSGVNVVASPVVDTTDPIITLLGDATVNLTVGDSYTDAGATALDDTDGDITANIVVGGDTVDPNTAGTYTITYNVDDAASNSAAEVTRTVIVAEATASVVLSFTGVNVVALRNQISSVSGFNLDSALTVNTDNAVDLTTASTITATLGGQSLTGITVVDSDTFTADAITGGLQVGAEHDLILTVDGLASNAYAVTLGNKTGHNTVTQITPHAEAFYKDFSGVGPDLIGADDQIIAPVQTNDLRNLTITTNGLVEVEGAENDPDDQVFTWFYLDAQDGYARSPAQTFTVYNQVDTPNDLVVIDSIIPNRTSAVVNFSYPGTDVTSYEYNIGGAWIACTSPLTISSLTEDTLYTLNIRPKNINSVGTSTQTTFTTLSAVDTTPNAFTIPLLAGQLLSDPVTFTAFTVSGVDVGVDIPVSITNGTYSVSTDNGSTWGAPTGSNTNVRLNYQIRVHHTTSASYSDPVSSVITVGGVSGTATSTTKADDVIPVITLIGGASIEINEGDIYSDVLGTTVTASDNVDGDISNNITITGSVDGNTVGTYTLSYSVTDAAGNVGTASRVVSVVAASPIIPIPSGRKSILNTTPTSTVYLGRDNEITWQLQVDGVAVPDNSITKAELYIPGIAFSDGLAVTYSTDDSQLSFETNNTVLKVELGHVATILPGRYTCKLTLFDGVDVEGLAWTEELITFKDWRV